MSATREQEFGGMVLSTAKKQLEALLGTEAGKKAAQSVTMAFVSAMRTAKDPQAFLDANPASVAACVATAAETTLYPGGPYPVSYLVPQSGDLQFRINHRGLAILYQRAGFGVMPVPVGREDRIKVAYGEVSEHDSDPTSWPSGKDDLVGVIVVVRRLVDGVIICRAWVPLAVIEKRRKSSKMPAKGPWADWYVEMAQKTAVLWCQARGLIPTDSPELRAALEADLRGEAIDVPQKKQEEGPKGDAALGLQKAEPRLLTEDVIGNGLAEEEDNKASGKPELVVVKTETTDESPL